MPSTTRILLRSLLFFSLAPGMSLLGCWPDDSGRPEPEPASGTRPAGFGPVKVGEIVIADIRSPAFQPPDDDPDVHLVWERELFYPDATYIAPHFASFFLPAGAHLLVRTPDNKRSRRYDGKGKVVPGGPSGNGFWGMHMPGERAILQLHSNAPLDVGAVVLDSFARGLPIFDQVGDPDGQKALCGGDDSLEARCYESSEPLAYEKSLAVARLLISGTDYCTGWLLGSEGHVMTSATCIPGGPIAADTDFEFKAEGSSCATACASPAACPGTVVADTSTLTRTNIFLGYSMVKLPVNPTAGYGFLQLRDDGARLGERIYIPQHPLGWGKRIAMLDDGSPATVTDLSATPCIAWPISANVAYLADTRDGSLGAPVLSYDDNTVVSMHICGGSCPNSGLSVTSLILDLGASMPADAVVSCPLPLADAGPDVSVCLGDSVQIGAPPVAGHTYLWEPGGLPGPEVVVSPTVTTDYTVTATSSCSSATDTVTVTVVGTPTGPCTPDQPNGSPCYGNSACNSGFCADGVCCDQACSGDCQACSAAAGSGADGSCQALASGTVCRASAGPCDVAETCTGAAPNCPVDAVMPASAACRPMAGGCDIAEMCDGVSVDCPDDVWRPTADVCRPSTGSCDPAEICGGLGPYCPDDALVPAGEPCRTRVGACDVTEVCDGIQPTCPADQLAPPSQLCRSAFEACDVPEFCDGMSADCPADAVLPDGTMCRDASGVCDAPEVCDGVNPACPANALVEAGATCRAAIGACDAEEVCDGQREECPEDALREAGDICRDTQGACDLVETCDGASLDCPDDEFVAADVVCRDAVGACDVAESCDGLSGMCPPDAVMAAGQVCRSGADGCNPEETCTGVSAACPDDFQLGEGAACQVSGCANEGTCLSGACQLEDGDCQPPGRSGGCNCHAADSAAGHGTASLLLLALFLGTRRRDERG